MSFGRFGRAGGAGHGGGAGGAGGAGSAGGRAGPAVMADINMTPLIDVMLVLLVIFMVTAPLMTSSLRLDLPRSDAATPSEAPRPLLVSVDAQGRLFLGEERVDREQLAQRAAAAAEADPRAEVQLQADKALPYGQIVELIGLLQKAGLTRIAFAADPGSVR